MTTLTASEGLGLIVHLRGGGEGRGGAGERKWLPCHPPVGLGLIRHSRREGQPGFDPDDLSSAPIPAARLRPQGAMP